MSYIVAQRMPEMGIRIALGATPADVLRIVMWQGLRLSLLGAALEDDFVRGRGGNESQCFRNAVVLLNDCSAQSAFVEMFRCPKDCLLEIWVFKELHVSGVP